MRGCRRATPRTSGALRGRHGRVRDVATPAAAAPAAADGHGAPARPARRGLARPPPDARSPLGGLGEERRPGSTSVRPKSLESARIMEVVEEPRDAVLLDGQDDGLVRVEAPISALRQ